MKRYKTVIWGALAGAAAGALVGWVALHGHGGDIRSLFDHAASARWQWMGAALGWVVFSFYWEAAAKNAAEAKSSESRPSRGVHVFLTNAALILEMVPLRGFGRFVPVSAAIMTAGLAVEAMGLSLAILARRHLGRNWSGEISIKVDHRLIRSGPYQMLRHPIYTGLLTMYAGTALVAGSWLALAGFALAVFAYARKIRLEEVNLGVAFGAEYEAYRRETWALVPGLF
jgi:protein-S-isoprenylcysteine O-methyltransferase Ste14